MCILCYASAVQVVCPASAIWTRTKGIACRASILKAMNMINYRPTSVLSLGRLYIVTITSAGKMFFELSPL